MAIATILANEIQSIQVIEKSKNCILIVTQRNSNRPIVVKSEERRGRDNVGAMLEFHATLFSKLRALPFETEKLSLAEIDALKACSPTKVSGAQPYSQQSWRALLDGKVLNIGEPKEMKAAIKISYVEELADLQGISGTVNELQALRAVISPAGAEARRLMTELGQILAVDFFIGNGDRFQEQENPGSLYPRGSIKGDQNIFFQYKNNRFQAVGIDTYDAGGPWSDLNQTIEELERKNECITDGPWPGRILAPGATRQRDATAQGCVRSLLSYLYDGGYKQPPAPGRPNASGEARLVKALHKGISEAKDMLRSKFALTDNLQGLSKGLASRWKIVRG